MERGGVGSNIQYPPSPSEKEWKYQKSRKKATSTGLDKIMQMIGLEEVKRQMLRIKYRVDIDRQRHVNLGAERFGLVLLGNPGTGIFLTPSHLDLY